MSERTEPDWIRAMGFSIVATDAVIESAAWHWRMSWWAWLRWQKGWMFWTPPKRVLKDAARGFVTNLRARVPGLGRR